MTAGSRRRPPPHRRRASPMAPSPLSVSAPTASAAPPPSLRLRRTAAGAALAAAMAGWPAFLPSGLVNLGLDLRGGAEMADAVCRNVRLVRHATSLGGVESTMERRAAIPGQGHLPPSLLRLSVGIEDADDLWADLDSAIRSAAP